MIAILILKYGCNSPSNSLENLSRDDKVRKTYQAVKKPQVEAAVR